MVLMPPPISRVTVTPMTGRALDEAVAFAALHPVGQLDGPTRLRLLTQLTSAPQGTIVIADSRGELALVATVLDVIAESARRRQGRGARALVGARNAGRGARPRKTPR